MRAGDREDGKAGQPIAMAAVLPAAILWGLAVVTLVLTFLPMWNTSLWWVRTMDFPRLQIGVVGG